MKRFLIVIFSLLSCQVFSQYSNSWIDHSKTYYKFKVAHDSLYRITHQELTALGLANVPAEHFQLWRNGDQQPLFITKEAGALNADDYIEFYGKRNDGRPDKKLYRKPDYQLTDYRSLFTDTAAYFLTVNTTAGNLRYTKASNPAAPGDLQPEAFFMNKRAHYYDSRINPGFSISPGGISVYSSSYDIGEGWTSNDINPGQPLYITLEKLNMYADGPPASLDFGLVGNAPNSRTVKIRYNSSYLFEQRLNDFEYIKKTVENISYSFNNSSSTVTFAFENASAVPTDRMVVSHLILTYPSKWNFNDESKFSFEMPPSGVERLIEIENFNHGGTPPVLISVHSRRRYTGDITTKAGKVRFVLPATLRPEEYQLYNVSARAVVEVKDFEKVTFEDFAQATAQGDYLIITNKALFRDGQGKNHIERYHQYRSSQEGGGYKVRVIDIEELVDQFAYGIKKHPSAIKDFVKFAMEKFSIKPRFVFLIGKGVTYDAYTKKQSDPVADKLNLVPTFGYPASDVLLVSPYGSAVPSVGVGRLSVVSGEEVGDYLAKMKEYEQKQSKQDLNLQSRLWMKNVIQIIGGQDNDQSQEFRRYMNRYKDILTDTLFGANVELFAKTSNSAVQLLRSQRVEEYFREGISIISYFGHSSASVLDFNLNEPSSYDNPGKYPFFMVSGCTAGNNYIFDEARLSQNNKTISENFVLAPNRGSIAFFASTHFGLPLQLNEYNTRYFKDAFINNYGLTVGEHQKNTIRLVGGDDPDKDYFTRTDFEEMTLHGDPAIQFNISSKPDYVIEDQYVKVDPSFVSVSETKFALDAKIFNTGKAIDDSITLTVKRTYPNGASESILRKRIAAIRYADSIRLEVPIIPTRDKGRSAFTITIDADNEVDELSEANNTVIKEVYIYEDEARPAYPPEFAIVNHASQKLYASTANPLSEKKTYVMEIDTTAEFNSAAKKTMQVISAGGLLTFDPVISYQENRVYYWRVAVKPATGQSGDYHWNTSSFVYLPGSIGGANQSHYYQHLHSDTQNISLYKNRQWKFTSLLNTLEVRNGVWGTGAKSNNDMVIEINGTDFTRGICSVSTIVFSVIDPVSLKFWKNSDAGEHGSDAVCNDNMRVAFQYSIMNAASRNAAMKFLRDVVPPNSIVVARSVGSANEREYTFASQWQADTAVYGKKNSLYHALKENGFYNLDSFNRPRSFAFVFQKLNDEFTPVSAFTQGMKDVLSLKSPLLSVDTVGYITSPKFGPAKKWKEMQWNGKSMEANSTDRPKVIITGIDKSGKEKVLFVVKKEKETVDISSIDAGEYPFVVLKMENMDSVNLSPWQLDYWRLLFEQAPEGALAPNLYFSSKDTLSQGEPLDFGIAFQNISEQDFDSLAVSFSVIDKNNISKKLPVQRLKPLVSADSATFLYRIETKDLTGANTLFMEFNPHEDQPEQYHFNNFIYRNFFVKTDMTPPLLDVTFDGVHILNSDIISARPHILIKLRDENKYMALKDTSLLKVQVRYPDGALRDYSFNNDTLRFTPPAGKENEATIDFTPYFEGNDDVYELIVSGKDAVGNKAGEVDYHVKFRVFSKPMISNLLNYPNPFTTSTAFVFTLTGSVVPQNIRIQILTVTGKVVREITREELGPLRIGRNITDFKWDGTDMYGQRLANGVYLYRVLTNLDGKRLDRFQEKGDNTDQYFTSGYGKMYLMR